ncbi:MAG: helix-turn-helix domain-containing protein, partial [Candidatus Dormibacteraceae bacterium]
MTDTTAVILNTRRAAGLTQAELARRSHTSQPAINRYEQGRTIPRPATLRRLLDACRTRIKPSEALKKHRREILEFARNIGAKNVMVFGSIARGEDTEDSDVD